MFKHLLRFRTEIGAVALIIAGANASYNLLEGGVCNTENLKTDNSCEHARDNDATTDIETTGLVVGDYWSV